MARPVRGTQKRDARLSLSLEPEQRERYHAFATRQGKSLTELICEMLEKADADDRAKRRLLKQK